MKVIVESKFDGANIWISNIIQCETEQELEQKFIELVSDVRCNPDFDESDNWYQDEDEFMWVTEYGNAHGVAIKIKSFDEKDVLIDEYDTQLTNISLI